VREFRERYPQVEVVLHSMDRAEQIKALRERRITVGFNRFFGDEPDLDCEVIHREQMNVVLPAKHALARRAALSLAELAREVLILYPRNPRPGFIDYLMRLFQARGLVPRAVQEVDDVLTATALVSAGMGLSLVTDSGRNLSIPGITHRPLRPADRTVVDLSLAFRRGDDSPLTRGFLDVARALRSAPPATPGKIKAPRRQT
jgi:DNA-binding transcriptional LysR family regulator